MNPPAVLSTGNKIVLATISGLLLTCAFPKIGWHGVAWVALVPLLLALIHVSPFNGFRLGLITGLVHQTTLIYWMVHTMNQYGNLPWAVSIPIMFLLAFYLALYPAVFAWIISRFLKDCKTGMVLMPFLWVALEYFRTFVFSGFPWELLGYSQFQNLRLIQMADIFGVYGVSFLIVFVNVAVFIICCRWIKSLRVADGVSKSMVMSLSALAFIFLASAVGYGNFMIKRMDALILKAPKSTITVVQGNIDQGLKWDPKFQKQTIDKYITLSHGAKPHAPDLIVWPETAAPFYFFYDQALTEITQKGIQQAGTDFLLGAPSFTVTHGNVSYFNSAYLLKPDGSMAGKYDKIHLVPFGEYVPFKKWLPFVGKIVEHVGDFQAGQKGFTLPWGRHHLGVLICYELIFPDLSARATRNGANALVNLTNDAWYGRTSAPYQHFSMAVFRAVENRRALIRSANTGFSGFIDPVGRILNQTHLFADAVATASIPMLSHQSIYTRFGDVFSWCCVAISCLLTFLGFRKHARQ